MEHVTISVYDYGGKKLADFYDSQQPVQGQAYDISVTYELNGNRKQDFSLPYLVDDASNWRWKYIKSEYRIRLRIGSKEDWFIVTSPKKSKSNKQIGSQVTCDHLSSILKTKNLYLYFDDENGIGTAPYLMNQIMKGTGWSFDEDNSDVFYENYTTTVNNSQDVTVKDETVKKRTLSSSTKTGSYALVAKVCDLFGAYPIYHADTKTVTLHAVHNKLPMKEMIIGKNLTALSVNYDSDSIVTRLYVEGNYQDNGDYVGIDDINPSKLSFLLNFDYYKDIGAFTTTPYQGSHQEALDNYLSSMKTIRDSITINGTILNVLQSKLAILWGQVSYVLWTVKDKKQDAKYIVGDMLLEKQEMDVGDKIYIFTDDRKYTTIIITAAIMNSINNGTYLSDNVTHVLKFSTACNGSIGAKEAFIESKEKINEKLAEDNRKNETTEAQKARNNDIISANLQAIQNVYDGGVSESYEFKMKVAGSHMMKSGQTVPAMLSRESTSLLSSATHYIDKSKTVTVKSDASLTTYQSGNRFLFDEYGSTGAIQDNLSVGGFEDVAVYGMQDDILDVNTVQRQVNVGVNNVEQNAVAVYVQGTTFTFSVPTLTYGLYEQYYESVLIAEQIGVYSMWQNRFISKQTNIETEFAYKMGDLLRDGYWNNDNYIAGQEVFLYNDALDIMKEISKPSVSYTVTLQMLSELMDTNPFDVDVNTQIRIYDPELEVNDIVYVKKVTKYLDAPEKSNVEISNEEVQITGDSFDSIFRRITDIADLVEQRKNVFERASAQTNKGSLATTRLEGAINLLSTRLSSVVSNWYTDDNGNIVFESSDGTNCMMLCGEGFMIASGKNPDGTWNWRTKNIPLVLATVMQKNNKLIELLETPQSFITTTQL